MSKPPPEIHLHAHPSERGWRGSVAACIGCCCSCCCVHALGGLIGAIMGSERRNPGTPYPVLPPGELERRTTSCSPMQIHEGAFQPSRSGFISQLGNPLHGPLLELDEGACEKLEPPRRTAVRLFWYLNLASSIVLILLGWVCIDHPSGMTGGLCLFVIFYPAIQLGCAAISFVVILVLWRNDRWEQVAQIGFITAGVIIGSVVGSFVLIIIWLEMR